ncbi:MAG: radical SAM protein, partial [Oscillospiraceae bacterium]|nr:radical SAM protein [Oscillospiraceae bacterium]
MPITNTLSTNSHPCYNCGAGSNARMHLPIAPKCNIQCNYCLRKYDCASESRPGVVSEVLSPEAAAEKFSIVKEKLPNITVAGIAGPGDALANWEQTARTLQLIRKFDKNVIFCLSTNGLLLPDYAAELHELGVSHLTVTLNAVDPLIGAEIYKWAEYQGKLYTGIDAADLLITNQLAGLRKAVELGLVCKVNTVAVKNVNTPHIPQVAETIANMGIYIHNIMPHIAVDGSVFAGMPTISRKELDALRDECGVHLRQMRHCRQ